jgi:hypothetical protein
MQQTYIVTIQYIKSTDSNAMQCCNKVIIKKQKRAAAGFEQLPPLREFLLMG